MNFELAEEHRMLKDLVRKFVDSELLPLESGVLQKESSGQGSYLTAEQLAKVVLELLADQGQGQRLGLEARRTVEQRYRLQQASDAYDQLMLSLKLSATRA